MIEFVTAVRRALRDQHKLRPLKGSTPNDPLLKVPDGYYQVVIDGKKEYVRTKDDCTTFLNSRPRKFRRPKIQTNTVTI